MLSFRELLKELLPPVACRLLNRARPASRERLRFTGDYASWDAAVRDSGGYAAPEILEVTRQAMLKIKRGEAVYERDSVLFNRAEPPLPLISGLLLAASHHGNRLRVLDFGGALGSSYYQCRPFLGGLADLRWCVVEQPAHVVCGRAEFEDQHLGFYASVEECIAANQPNVLLLSSVLQYLPSPYATLANLIRHPFTHVVVDRTAFNLPDRDRLTVQHVPSTIYPASYPAWFLSKSGFLACFGPTYHLICSFSALDKTMPERGSACYEGFIFERSGVIR